MKARAMHYVKNVMNILPAINNTYFKSDKFSQLCLIIIDAGCFIKVRACLHGGRVTLAEGLP